MIGAVAGGVAEVFYGSVPGEIVDKVREILNPDLWEGRPSATNTD